MSSEPAENKAPHSPARSPNYYNNNKAIKTTTLKKLALRLYDLGFNVVPVDSDKRPLTAWSPGRRLEREQLAKLLDNANGIAIVGGPENPWKPVAMLVIIDIDNPDALEKTEFLKKVVESTVSWYTGPRCPRCNSKNIKFINEIKSFRCGNCGAEFELDDAKRGVASLVSVDLSSYEKYLKGTVRTRDVEFLVNNYALIPPSKHPSGVHYEWVRPFDFDAPDLGIYPLIPEELQAIVEEVRGKAKPVEGEARALEEDKPVREFKDSEILELKEMLREVYQPGVRQFIWLFLGGWGARARVSPVSIARALKMLYEETGDNDPIKTRAGAIVYSYKKAGLDVDAYARELEEVLGVRPYGLEREIREAEIKGRSGLQEILEQTLGEERALEVIRRIEELFETASPYRDSVIEVLDYEKQIYAVANLRRRVIVRARRVDNKLVYREAVVNGAPVEVTVYINPIDNTPKYLVRWESPTRPNPIVIGPAYIEDVVSRLKILGLVKHRRLVEDVITAILEGYIRKGRAEVKLEIDSPGFYEVGGRLLAVRVDVSEPTLEELREALELLNELAGVWYKHAEDRFATVVKWAVIAPFIYVLKQRGRWVKWLYLYGKSRTGKTTLGSIALSIWGLDSRFEKTGSNVDTPARLGHVLSLSTFPVLVNEPGGALAREDIVEMVKNAVESKVARGKYLHGSYTEIPALAPIIFTSNRYLPRDDALLRRLIVLRFTFAEAIPEDKAEVFERNVKPKLTALRHIGRWVAHRVTSNPEILDKYNSWEELAEALLAEFYREDELELPEWFKARVREEEDIYEDVREAITAFLIKKINEEYTRFVGRVLVETSQGEFKTKERYQLEFKERCKIVLENKLIPWAVLKDSNVYLLTPMVEELTPVIGDIGGLKSIAELMGWEYRKVKAAGKSVWAALTSLDVLIQQLSGEIED